MTECKVSNCKFPDGECLCKTDTKLWITAECKESTIKLEKEWEMMREEIINKWAGNLG